MNSGNTISQENKNLNFLAFFVQLIAFMFLCGWIFNTALIRKIDLAAISMNPLTAVSFILIGFVILTNSSDSNNATKKNVTLFISFFFLIPVLLTISDFLFYSHFNADRFFFDQRITTFKMSAAAAINFLLIGLALLLYNASNKTARFASQCLIFSCLYLSLIYFFGYVYNVGLVGIPSLIPMQLHTSLLFITVCLGLLFLNSQEGILEPIISSKPGGIASRKFLPLLLCSPFVIGVLSILVLHRSYDNGFMMALFSVILVLLGFVIIWYFARLLNIMDGSVKGNEMSLQKKLTALQRSECLLSEMGKMAKVGIWEIYLYDDIPPIWSEEIYSIYKFKSKEVMTLETAMKYYKPESRKILMEHFHKAMTVGTPYDLELKLITSNAREIWVHAIGCPIHDDTGQIIGVRGVLQDIEDLKRKEFLLQVSLNVIEDQNRRLLSFSNTVSANLMGHSKNLAITLGFLREQRSEIHKNTLIEEISETSESINVAIAHLNEIVRIEANIDQQKSLIKFEDIINEVTEPLQTEIDNSNIKIHADFSACEFITYLPAYLKSIFQNLVTNTIKYKEEGVPVVVTIKSYLEDSKPVLTFSNIGLGALINKNPETEIGLFKTITHTNARGTWLSLTKSQVEALGGSIEMQSSREEGTIFKITF